MTRTIYIDKTIILNKSGTLEQLALEQGAVEKIEENGITIWKRAE